MEQIVLIGGRANGARVEVKKGAASYYQLASVDDNAMTVERYVRMIHETHDGVFVFRHQFMTGEVE